MRFLYGKQDMRTLSRAQENSFLVTNGLGGYASLSSAFSVPRCDQGVLVAAVKAPNERLVMVHRLREVLELDGRSEFLSTQTFADGTPAEEGYRHLACFEFERLPRWSYEVGGVRVTRRLCMEWGKNTTAVQYTVENRSGRPCTLRITPMAKFAPKEEALEAAPAFTYKNGGLSARCARLGGPTLEELFGRGGRIVGKDRVLYLRTEAKARAVPARAERLAYPEDAKDGRPAEGWAAGCCEVALTVKPGQTADCWMVFSTDREPPAADALFEAAERRLTELEQACGFKDETARQLALAADAFIARRDSTAGKTILAGYPLFSDWGRDTMIALPGCTLATGRFQDAKSILRTFLAYEQDGLVPNLFPEGNAKPMYNTVDAALLLIDCVWQYVKRTGDLDFAREAWPVMERIIAAYKKGTRHSIRMDADGLICAGGGMDQVTWMDVCVQGILPTPRHGKPVEINAYWYNALCVMEALAQETGCDGTAYGRLAAKVKRSFVKAFWIREKGWLRDVVSGTAADEQLRCNQIWAVSMPFTMLTPKQEKSVVDAVYRHLYTPCGLRTLSPEDPEYHPTYGGAQVVRDMAYHQGTTWVFPMGAYYLAYLKVNGSSPAAVQTVREQLSALQPMLREGCAGQLPEIYDGEFPTDSKGCFAQAWSVGEMLRVFEALERAPEPK